MSSTIGNNNTAYANEVNTGLLGNNSSLNNSGLNSGLNNNLQSNGSGWNQRNSSGLNNSGNLNSGLNNSGGINSGLNGSNYVSTNSNIGTTIERVTLPTQVRELPVAVHEEIRQELVEEIQPEVLVEKYQTEVHQISQPLFDKEIRPVNIQHRTLAREVLPEVQIQGRGIAMQNEISTVRNLRTEAMIVEKPAVFVEVDRKQIIEEIQPVVYKETIVPTVIQETKPIYQKIVEGPVYVSETLPAQQLTGSRFTYPSNYNNEALYNQGTNFSGLNQGGLNQQGFSQGQQGFNQQGLNQGGLNQGLNQGGINQGLNQGGLNQQGFNQQGLNQGGLNQQDKLYQANNQANNYSTTTPL